MSTAYIVEDGQATQVDDGFEHSLPGGAYGIDWIVVEALSSSAALAGAMAYDTCSTPTEDAHVLDIAHAMARLTP
jgi:hypothetical protein